MSLSPLSGSEPVFNPIVWNKDKAIQKSHNCYAYAIGQISPSETEICKQKQTSHKQLHCQTPQPGYASGHPKMRNTPIKRCKNIMKRTLDDNMTSFPTTFTATCPVGMSKIALVVDRKHDYHYYRQDSNGLWSHKPGRNPVTNLDANGNLIKDPRYASRDYRSDSKLNYNSFCGYMCVARGQPQTLTTGGTRKATNAINSSRKQRHRRCTRKSSGTDSIQ